jgi:hypothetical protein
MPKHTKFTTFTTFTTFTVTRAAKIIYSSFLSQALTYSKRDVTTMRRGYEISLSLIDPNDDSVPQACTIFWSTIFFITFLVFGGLAIGYPEPWMRIAVVVVGSTTFISSILLAYGDTLVFGQKPSKTQLKSHYYKNWIRLSNLSTEFR